jgi:hypothetical protein
LAELTENELQSVRAWVGTQVDTSKLQERMRRLGDIDEVVLEELRSQHSELMQQPSQLGVDGLSIGIDGNLTALERKIRQFISEGGLGLDADLLDVGPNVTRLVRPDIHR